MRCIESLFVDLEMVVVQTKGGLGNQLFQYAVGRSVAVASNMELVIDPYWHSQLGFKETARSFELDRYGTKFRLASKAELAMWMPFRSRFAPLIV